MNHCYIIPSVQCSFALPKQMSAVFTAQRIVSNFMNLTVGANHPIELWNLHLFWDVEPLKQHITKNVWCEQPSSPEPLWLLSEPWPAGQTQLLGCVRNQTSVFAGGIESQKASLHGSPWSLTCSYFEPTNSHQDALWEMLFLSAVLLTCHFSLAGSTPSLPPFPLI